MTWINPRSAGLSKTVVIIVFILLLIGVFVSSRWADTSSFLSRTSHISTLFSSNQPTTNSSSSQSYYPKPAPYIPLTCPSHENNTNFCTASNYSFSIGDHPPIPPPSCPSYFRWIHEDLRPWGPAGITLQMVEAAKPLAAFRLVVIDGRAYLHKYRGVDVFQTRDVFTLWGLLQLLRRYPGRVPDVDLMFNLGDVPVVRAENYASMPAPPPLFRYCKDDSTVDIVFPDWSFWGWPEVNVKPWEVLIEEIRQGNKRLKWKKREPYAYWKGNPWVSETRQDLMKCNLSKHKDWNARLYSQDWGKETQGGFKSSNLASQCTHRYKIYIEGRAWSVSEKYIMACDSPTLLVNTGFWDFFSRGLMPGKHYLPIRENDKCRSIKSAVDWGNSHKKKAQGIGKEGSKFTQEELNMGNVYDYMLHLITEYSKLLTYKPSVPEDAVELCVESMACTSTNRVKEYMMESMVRAPHHTEPCAMSPPFSPVEMKEFMDSKAKAIARTERWD